MVLEDIITAMKAANTIVILTHENPDGDAIGSTLAMYLSLKKLGKQVDMIIPEHARIYDFLPSIQEVKKASTVEQYDLAIALDAGDIKRLNGFANYFENAKTKVSIDHHISNTMFADFNFVNHVSPATAQVLITVLDALGVELDKDISTCLCVGIITDTGGFKYPCTTRETFEFMSLLLGKGINISMIYRKVFDLMSVQRFELNKIAMNRLELLEGGKIAFTYITMEDEEKTNAGIGEYEGIVNIGQNIEGVNVSIFVRQTKEGYKISLRSVGNINVADICFTLGGGGHQNAAGCSVSGLSFEQAKMRILNETRKYI